MDSREQIYKMTSGAPLTKYFNVSILSSKDILTITLIFFK